MNFFMIFSPRIMVEVKVEKKKQEKVYLLFFTASSLNSSPERVLLEGRHNFRFHDPPM